MQLELQVSPMMSVSGEDSLVRLSEDLKRQLKVKKGDAVVLSTKSGEKLRLLAADPISKDEENRLAYVSYNTFNSVVNGKKEKFLTTLGCDPEFVFLDSRRSVVHANYWLPARGQIGSDGPLAELRPTPGAHEYEVVENLRALIKQLPGLIRNKFDHKQTIHPEGHSCWQNYAIGFHIHLGAPKEIITYAAPNAKDFLNSFVTVLDYFVGIPAMLLEDNSIRRLGNGAYGKPGDYRITPQTIEYRTPGGFHLRHPEYSAGIMGLALCIGKELLEDTDQASCGWRFLDQHSSYDLFRKRFSLPEKNYIRSILLQPSKKLAVEQLPNIINQLKELRSFPAHSDSIKSYLRLIVENKQHSPNLLKNW